MRKAAMLLLVALLVGALPAAAVPISMFPEPFVKAGTIYTPDGKATMAIIIGDKAASADMIGAAMIAMKIGSHLYYTNAPYVSIEDAKANKITLYYGGFDANEYYISKTTWELVPTIIKNHYLFFNATSTRIGNETNLGEFAVLGGAKCNTEGYDYVLAPLDAMKLYPARFHFILGENATISDTTYVKPSTTLGFYVQTGLKEFSNTTGNVNIPWLGFTLHVDNIYINSTTGEGVIHARLLNAEGMTVAYMNITNGYEFKGVSDANTKVVGDVKIKVKYDGKGTVYEGVPYFKVINDAKNWVVLWKTLILANITSANFIANATTDEIRTHYKGFASAIKATAVFNETTYPVKAWGIFNVSGDSNGWTYIWSKDVFPWFDGAVNAYIIFNGKPDIIYVFDHKTGIVEWGFNKTWSEMFPWWNKTECGDFVFTSIGNRTITGAVPCPLWQEKYVGYENCTYICGNWTGVYKLKSTEDVVEKLKCPPITDEIAFNMTKSTVYARGATGVFAGIFDRFENKTGSFKGTTQIEIETVNGIAYPKDVTNPKDVDQEFEGEEVFSFVKMPVIYLDSWVFANNTLREDLKNKDLILIGGPAVNAIVRYLNDAGVLDVKFKLVNNTWALEYAGKTYDLSTVLYILVDKGVLPTPTIAKECMYAPEGYPGLGVVEYAKTNPFGSGNILVVAGTDRYGTLVASVALADPTKLVSKTAGEFYKAGQPGYPNAVILLGIKPTVVPPPAVVPALIPTIVAIPPGAAGPAG